ncbi:clathrin coat assembly protein AP180 [Embiotoca jacksoni]|uniref:clathrin coat assembly protein AP180 n=1 Tax=Embiotoca jacksoni TaxID=100190 RepID=UPI003703D445
MFPFNFCTVSFCIALNRYTYPLNNPNICSPPSLFLTHHSVCTGLKSECTYDCVSLFLDMFDSMPEQSPTTESKAATTPSVDLFGADLPAVSRGPSPLPEPTPAGDIVTDSYSAPAPAPAPTPAAAPAPAPAPAAAAAAPAAALEASSPPKPEPEPVIDLLDSFGGSVAETQSSAPGGPADDLLGGLMSPTLAPTAAPALAPALVLAPAPALAPALVLAPAPALAPALAPVLASAPVHNDLLESGFDALASLPSPTPLLPAAVAAAPIVPAIAEPASTTQAPSGSFDASMFGGLGDLLMPAITPQSTGGSTAGSTAGSMGTPVPATPPPSKTIGGDLDSSLANLIGDLGVKKKDPGSEKKLTGGANWTPQVAPTSWATPGAPMTTAAPGAPVAPGAAPSGVAMVPPMSAQPGFGMPPAAGPGAPMMQPMMGQPMMGQPMMRPSFTGVVGVAPLSPGPASQNQKKPKDPLAELDLKDFL